MGQNFIPVRLDVVDICIAALIHAADGIEAAADKDSFVSALADNHHVWMALREGGLNDDWFAAPGSRDARFAILTSSGHGRRISDGNVEALIAINRRVAGELAGGRDIDRIRARAWLGYQDGNEGGFLPWLTAQLSKKRRLLVTRSATSEPCFADECLPAVANSFG